MMTNRTMCALVLAGSTAFAGVQFVGAPAAAQACGPHAAGQASESDKHFLDKASQGNVAEVEMAKLALSKSQNGDVRDFAKKMIHDHEMLARKMKPFVKRADLQPATALNPEHQELYDRLKGLSGDEFNKEYVKAMDKDHHEDLEDFKKEIADTNDAPLKTAVENGEKVIEQHVEMIDGIARKMGMEPASA